MKKSKLIVNLLRGVLIVLAYKEITHPKGGIIPPGTGRFTAQYLKSCYQISRSWLKTHLHAAKFRTAGIGGRT